MSKHIVCVVAMSLKTTVREAHVIFMLSLLGGAAAFADGCHVRHGLAFATWRQQLVRMGCGHICIN
jgi:hypothetical protein